MHYAAIYGDTLFWLDENHAKIPRISYNPAYRMPFCHQSVFVRTDLLKQHKFDTSFKICADSAFFTHIYRQGAKFLYINIIVSVYNAHGLSSKPSWQYFKEELRIIAHTNVGYAPIFCAKYALTLIKYGIKSLLPRSLRFKLQSLYNAKQS